MTNDHGLALGSSMMYMANARVIGNFIYSGLLDRFPTLKILSVESGIGWIPFILRALDYQGDENNIKNLEMKPSEYFKRQVFGCFWFEDGKELLEDVARVVSTTACSRPTSRTRRVSTLIRSIASLGHSATSM